MGHSAGPSALAPKTPRRRRTSRCTRPEGKRRAHRGRRWGGRGRRRRKAWCSAALSSRVGASRTDPDLSEGRRPGRGAQNRQGEGRGLSDRWGHPLSGKGRRGAVCYSGAGSQQVGGEPRQAARRHFLAWASWVGGGGGCPLGAWRLLEGCSPASGVLGARWKEGRCGSFPASVTGKETVSGVELVPTSDSSFNRKPGGQGDLRPVV